MKVELNNLMKLFSIFVDKKWIQIDGYDDVLNNFGELIEGFNDEQVQLMLELTERYTWVTYNDYHTQLRKQLRKLYEKSLSKKNKVYIFPIIKPKDEENIKSGHAVLYMIDSVKLDLKEFKDIEFVVLHRFIDLEPRNLTITDTDFLILVDDYIGTGNTLTSTIEELNKNQSVKNNYAVLSVAIQEDAIDYLKGNKIEHYYGYSMNKGISNNYVTPILEQKIKTMQDIENKIPNIHEYRFGYQKSEALITLMKTPNNTFPVFWMECYGKRGKLNAPFARY